MTTVYVVLECYPDEGCYDEGVWFSTREKAESWVKGEKEKNTVATWVIREESE